MSKLPPVLDGHNDTVLDLRLPERGAGRSFFERSETGHIDLPRARDGGLAGGFFALFVPNDERPDRVHTDDGYETPLPDPIPTARARAVADAMLDRLHRIAREAGNDLRVVRTAGELRRCLGGGTIGAVAHLEGAEAVEPDLSNLDSLYERGVRSIGPVWSRPNAFGHGVPFGYPRSPDAGPGLTDAGRDLVRACNTKGILVDLAHLNERGFRDAAAISTAPLVATHTGVHAICPSSRNLTDEQLDLVGDSEGVVGVSFCVENLRPDGEQVLDTPLSVVVDHVEYVADRIGVDHVALGSDFDGCTVPDSIGDVAGLPDLLRALSERGFDGDELARIAHGNWLRVVEETWG